MEKVSTIKVIEKEGRLFGLPLSDIGIWAVISIGLILLPFLTDVVGIKLGTWYFAFVLVASITLYRLLMYFSKKKYPKYFLSMLSRLNQPKSVEPFYIIKDIRKDKAKENEKKS